MLRVARLARSQLRDASGLVRDFLLDQLDEDGGFRDREGKADLYYTVFGIEALLALGAELDVGRVARYLKRFGDGGGLDLVHLACLARCDADLGGAALSPAARRAVAGRIADFRSGDGGYGNEAGSDRGTVYSCFLALGACEDTGAELPEPARAREFIRGMATADGGYANERTAAMVAGSTPATAAAVLFLEQTGQAAASATAGWLLERCHERGGFFAAPGAPWPDLLSTATALHALAALREPLGVVREPCLDFLDSLWTPRGSFFAHWGETRLDAEYTFYALLALGHLSE
jgi:prenyltransferase beta subunit